MPASWRVEGARASHGQSMVRVATFALVKPYDESLFDKVTSELAVRMEDVARQVGGTVSGHDVVTTTGVKAHSYTVKVGDRTETYTFVLRGKREYQLLCSADARVCAHLLTSFDAG